MALSGGLYEEKKIVTLGNRGDYCYLCAREVTAKDEREYRQKQADLKGKLEGKKCIKINHNGMEFAICLEHIHKIAKENPLPKEEKSK